MKITFQHVLRGAAAVLLLWTVLARAQPPKDITLEGYTVPSGQTTDQFASNSVTAQNQVTVQNGGTGRFRGGRKVRAGTNVFANTGSSFRMMIDCNNNFIPDHTENPAIISPAVWNVPLGSIVKEYTTLFLGDLSTFNISGTLPAGLSAYNNNLQVNGQPTAAGTTTLTLSASGANGANATQSLQVNVIANGLVAVPNLTPRFYRPGTTSMLTLERNGYANSPFALSWSEGTIWGPNYSYVVGNAYGGDTTSTRNDIPAPQTEGAYAWQFRLVDTQEDFVDNWPAFYVDATAPSVNTFAAANVTTNSLTLNWAATDNFDPATTGNVLTYELLQGTTSLATNTTATTLDVPGLSAGTSYTFYVRAHDSAGNYSGWSSLNVTVNVATRATATLTVADQTVYNQGLLVVTSAILPANGVTGVSGLPAPTGTVTYFALRVNNPSQTFNPLTPNSLVGLTSFFGPLQVTASYPGDANYLPATKTVTFVNLDTEPPAVPTGLRHVVLGPTSFSLQWNAASDNSGPGVTYDVSLNGGNTVYISNLAKLTLAINDLAPNTTYLPAVRAKDYFGNLSGWSIISVATLAAGTLPSYSPQWIDIDGDGIRDELIPSDSPAFNIYESERSSRTVTVATWSWDFTPVLGLTFNDGWNLFVGGGWAPSMDETTYTVDTVIPGFQILAEPGYDYAVTWNVTPPNSPTVYAQLALRTNPPFVPADALNSVLQDILPTNPGGLSVDAFYAFPTTLVRIGKPAGGLVLNLPILGTVQIGTQGGLSGKLTLPGGITINANASGATASFPNGTTISTTNSGAITIGTNVGGYVVTANSNGQIALTNSSGVSLALGANGASLTLPGGLGVSMDGNGKVKLEVVAGATGNIIGNALDTLGKILGIGVLGPQVKVGVRPVGSTAPIIWEDPGTVDLGSRAPGDYDVAVKTDDDNNTHPNLIMWMNATVKPPPSIAFVKDKDNDYTIDTTDPVATFARVGHWGPDRSDGGVDGYLSGATGEIQNAPTPSNFVDKDPERFYIRVTDGSQNHDASAKETITVKIGTLLSDGTVDDDMTPITLFETGNNTGVFVSEAQLLVTKDLPTIYDDSIGVYSLYGTTVDHRVADDQPNDRTHRADIDGIVKAEYSVGGQAYATTIPVCQRAVAADTNHPAVQDERKVLNVVVHTFNEPWLDYNGNGAYDTNEPFVDIRNGKGQNVINGVDRASRFDTTGTWGPIWSEDQVNAQIDFLKAAFEQARIRVVVTRSPLQNPVDGLFAEVGSDQLPDTFGKMGVGPNGNILSDPVKGTSIASRDVVLIQNNYRANSSDGISRVDVYLVPPFSRPAGAAPIYGFAVSVGFIDGYSSGEPTLSASYANQLFVSLNAGSDNSPVILAHEVMHILTNSADAPDNAQPPQHTFFPRNSFGPGDGLLPTSSRRIQEARVIDARTLRDLSNPGATGNRILRDP